MKIAVCQFSHETNTLSPLRSDFESMARSGWSDAGELVKNNRGIPSYIGGAIKAAEEEGVGVIPISSLYGSAGPLILRDCVNHVLGVIQKELRTALDEIDGVFLALHGAGCAEGIDDLESHTLRAVREVVGNKPVMASLDLHANVTGEMVALSDGLFGIKEYPHTDMAEAGYAALKCLARTIRGEIKPLTALVRVPVLLPPSLCSTFVNPMKEIKEYVAAYAKERGLLDATLFHGFPYSDHSGTGVTVLAMADGRKPEAEALELARYFWGRRAEFLPVSLTPDEAIDIALAEVKDGFAVIHETSDNPGGGTPADGTHLLRALLERDVPRSIMGYIVDPEAAEICHKAGVGAKVDMAVGGKKDNCHGEPILVKGAEVLNLSNGKIVFTSPMRRGVPFDYGKSARVRCGQVEFILVSGRYQTLDDRAFLMTGADIHDYRIIGVKSSNHFRGFFQPLADVIVTADPPGLITNNFKSLTYARLRRPVFPLDEIADKPAPIEVL
ncbi:microcystinase C [Synergistales bacterium]|nr:microcystinase C [Synergistales bacterium]